MSEDLEELASQFFKLMEEILTKEFDKTVCAKIDTMMLNRDLREYILEKYKDSKSKEEKIIAGYSIVVVYNQKGRQPFDNN